MTNNMTDKETQIIEYGITDAALADLKDRLTGIDATENYDLAKTSLKECQQLRKKLTDAHKEKKSDALAFGRRLDTEKNRIMGKIKEVEDPIKETKDAVDQEAERKETARIEDFKARIDDIRSLGSELSGMSVADLEAQFTRLSEIDINESFEEYLRLAKSEYAVSNTNLNNAINTAKAVVAEAERLEKQRKEQETENARLEVIRKEQEETSRKLHEKQDEINRRQREEQEAIARKQEQEQARIDDERRELEQRQAKEKAEKERIAREQAKSEERDRAEKEAAKKAARLQPDTEKLSTLVDLIEATEMPDVKSDEAQLIIAETRESLTTVASDLRRSIKELA